MHFSPFAFHYSSWSQLKRYIGILENWEKLGAIKLRIGVFFPDGN